MMIKSVKCDLWKSIRITFTRNLNLDVCTMDYNLATRYKRSCIFYPRLSFCCLYDQLTGHWRHITVVTCDTFWCSCDFIGWFLPLVWLIGLFSSNAHLADNITFMLIEYTSMCVLFFPNCIISIHLFYLLVKVKVDFQLN